MTINGTPGNDQKSGHAGPDDFDMSQGGNDTVRGRGGDDTFYFGAAFTTDDRLIGGKGNDTLSLLGDTSVTLSAHNFSSVETVLLGAGFTYTMFFEDSAVANGARMNILGNAPNTVLSIDASLESHAEFDVLGGEGDDYIHTGGGDDAIVAGDGVNFVAPGAGTDHVTLGEDDDFVFFGTGGFDARDRVYGGDTDSENTIELRGDYSAGLTLGLHTITDVTKMIFEDGYDYVIDLGHSTLNTSPFTVDASQLGLDNALRFDGSHVLQHNYYELTGGAGNDVLIGGNTEDSFTGGGGADTMTADNSFGDSFFYNAAPDSTGQGYDTLINFDALEHFLVVPNAITTFNGKTDAGTLRTNHLITIFRLPWTPGSFRPTAPESFSPMRDRLRANCSSSSTLITLAAIRAAKIWSSISRTRST